jgi:NTP pyrophosphatase (non-canonical NTP hydrolase)
MKEFEPLDILQEECAEVIQSISKIRRFGWNSFSPLTSVELQKTNLKHLIEEIGDVLAVIDIVQQVYELNPLLIQQAKERKFEKLKIWSTIYSKEQESVKQISIPFPWQPTNTYKPPSIWKWPKFGTFSHLFWK